MVKQKKLIKCMLFVLMLIPIVLCGVGIVTTFVLKSKQNNLNKLNQNLNQQQQILNTNQDKLDYMQSDNYKKENFKHNDYDGKHYGDQGDINIELKQAD